jgi:hypothetical protein
MAVSDFMHYGTLIEQVILSADDPDLEMRSVKQHFQATARGLHS